MLCHAFVYLFHNIQLQSVGEMGARCGWLAWWAMGDGAGSGAQADKPIADKVVMDQFDRDAGL